MAKALDLIGKQFDYLTVTARLENNHAGATPLQLAWQ